MSRRRNNTAWFILNRIFFYVMPLSWKTFPKNMTKLCSNSSSYEHKCLHWLLKFSTIGLFQFFVFVLQHCGFMYIFLRRSSDQNALMLKQIKLLEINFKHKIQTLCFLRQLFAAQIWRKATYFLFFVFTFSSDRWAKTTNSSQKQETEIEQTVVSDTHILWQDQIWLI